MYFGFDYCRQGRSSCHLLLILLPSILFLGLSLSLILDVNHFIVYASTIGVVSDTPIQHFYTLSKATGTTATTTTAKSNSTTTPKCNSSLWKYIPTPSRLKILNPCITITGKVDVIRLHPPDGDTNLGIKVDSEYKGLLTKANFSNKLMHGDLWIEMICQHKNISDNPIKKGGCKGYEGPHFTVPSKGQYVRVIGSYVLDIREGGHAEIHPVSSIEVIE